MVSRPWLLLQGLHLLFCSFYGILLLWVLWYSILSKIIPSLFLQYPVIMHQDPQYFLAWHNPSSYSPGSLFLMTTSLSFETKVFTGLQTSLDDSNSCQSSLLVEGIPRHWLHLSMEHSLLALAYFYSKQRTVFTFTPEALELCLQPPSLTHIRDIQSETETEIQTHRHREYAVSSDQTKLQPLIYSISQNLKTIHIRLIKNVSVYSCLSPSWQKTWKETT